MIIFRVKRLKYRYGIAYFVVPKIRFGKDVICLTVNI